MNQSCSRCGGPTIFLFTSSVCKNECDLNQNSKNVLQEIFNVYDEQKKNGSIYSMYKTYADANLSLKEDMNLISQMCFGEDFKSSHIEFFKRYI